MKCKKCGTVLAEGAYFCASCGAIVEEQPVQESPDYDNQNNISSGATANPEADTSLSGTKECPYCGTMQSANMLFCGKCARPMNDTQRTLNRKYIAVIVTLCAILLGFISFFAAYAIYMDNLDDYDKNMNIAATNVPVSNSSVTARPMQTLAPTSQPSAVPSTAQQYSGNVYRTTLYSPYEEYKRMPEIHNSVRSSDNTFLELSSVIYDFNRCCETYMNNGDSEIFRYLKPGSTAYEQQTNYKAKHPNITQTYVSITVNDAREYGGYYYLWVTEVLDVTENGKNSQTTDHWVYKLINTTEGWVIEDYTKDPVS